MAESQKTQVTHAPPPGNTFGGPAADEPSDNISHQTTTRPANAGHVFSADQKEYEKRQGGIPEGTPMTRPVPDPTRESIPISEIKANAKAAEKENAQRVSTVGTPEPVAQPNVDHAGQGPLADRTKGGNASEFTTVRTPRKPPDATSPGPRKSATEATK